MRCAPIRPVTPPPRAAPPPLATDDDTADATTDAAADTPAVAAATVLVTVVVCSICALTSSAMVSTVDKVGVTVGGEGSGESGGDGEVIIFFRHTAASHSLAYGASYPPCVTSHPTVEEPGEQEYAAYDGLSKSSV
jgi:hypothetical protein